MGHALCPSKYQKVSMRESEMIRWASLGTLEIVQAVVSLCLYEAWTVLCAELGSAAR